jgi:hypothetical protein
MANFLPGLSTKLILSTQSVPPSFNKKNPFANDFVVKANVKNAAYFEIKGRMDSPNWPGNTVPKSNTPGNFKSLVCYILRNYHNTKLSYYNNQQTTIALHLFNF